MEEEFVYTSKHTGLRGLKIVYLTDCQSVFQSNYKKAPTGQHSSICQLILVDSCATPSATHVAEAG